MTSTLKTTRAKVITIGVVAALVALSAGAAIAEVARGREVVSASNLRPEWHDGYNHFIVRVPPSGHANGPNAQLQGDYVAVGSSSGCPKTAANSSAGPYQAVIPNPKYPIVLRPGQPASVLYRALQKLPKGTRLERDCNGNIRAIPPGAEPSPEAAQPNLGPGPQRPSAQGRSPNGKAVARAPTSPSASHGHALRRPSSSRGERSGYARTRDAAVKALRAAGVESVQVVGNEFLAVKTHLSKDKIASLTGGIVSLERLGAFDTLNTTVEPTPPDNPYFSQAYYLANWGQGGIGDLSNNGGGWPSTAGASADAAYAWPYSMGSGVTIADVDTGAADIPELSGQISALSENFVPGENSSDVSPVGTAAGYDHGTLVAEALAAKAGEGVGAPGVAPGAQVMELKVSDNATVTDAAVYQAGEYAIAHGAKIINLSLGFLGSDTLMSQLASDAAANGVLIVAAAGNYGEDNDGYSVSPANLAAQDQNVISVGASDMNDQRASYSDYGASTVDLMAPGSYIVSQQPDGSFVFASGTSLAAPMVSATAALMLARDPSLTAPEIKQEILATADRPTSLAGLTVTGGRLNAAAAVAGVASPVAVTVQGVNALTPGTAGQVAITAQVASTSAAQGAADLQVKAQLAYAYQGGIYGVVGQDLTWTGEGLTATATTSSTGEATFGSGFLTSDFSGSGVSLSFPLSVPSGSYALVVSLVDPGTGAPIANPEAVFFNVGTPTAPVGTTTTAPPPGASSVPAATTTVASGTTSPATPSTTQAPAATTTASLVAPASTTGPTTGSATTTAPAATTTSAPGTTSSTTTTTSAAAASTTQAPAATTTAPTTAPAVTAVFTPPSVQAPPAATSTTVQATTATTSSPPAATTTTTAPPAGPVEPASPTANFGITMVSPDSLGTSGGDMTVFGNALPTNAVVEVGSTYEAASQPIPHEIDVTVGALLPGLYSLTVCDAAETLCDVLPDAVQITSSGGGSSPTTSTSTTAATTTTGTPGTAGTSSTTTTVLSGSSTTSAQASTTVPAGTSTTAPPQTTTSTAAPSATTSSPATTVSTVATTTTTTPDGTPFAIANGLTIASLSNSYGVTGISPGTWGALACQQASCGGTTLAS